MSGTYQPNIPTDTPRGLAAELRKIAAALSAAWAALTALTASVAGKVDRAGDTMTGSLILPLGTVSAPSLAFVGDTDTGIYRSSANNIGLTTGATDRLLVGAINFSYSELRIERAAPGLVLNSTLAAPGARYIDAWTNGVIRNRLILGLANDETGSNVGSDWTFNAFDDTGVLLGAYMSGVRSTRVVTFALAPRSNTAPSAANDLVRKDYADNASNLSTGTVAPARLGSGTANNTTFLRGDGVWAAPPGGGFAPVVRTLAADFVSSVVTLATATGMTQAVGANETWKIEVFGTYRTAATTTGAGLSLLLPAGSVIRGEARLQQAADGVSSFFEVGLQASDQNYASASVVAANTDYVCLLSALVVVGGTAGNIELRWRSEIAASNATLRAGTRMIATRIA